MKKILMLLLSVLLVGCNFFNSSKKIELIPFLQKDKYGYFDLEGKIVINPQFQYASAFRNGIALVKTTGDEGKWGYIDKDGKFVINATYKDATVFQEGIAWVVSENSAPTAIDPKGEIKFTLKEAENVRLFSDELAAFSKPDSTSTIWGFVDKSGNQAVSPQFTEVGDFSDGKCAVKNKEGKWGFIDKSGKIIINYQFDSAEKFVDGKSIVYLDKKAGVIDEDGKYIINPQFQYAFIDEDKYLIYQDDKAGWCDDKGKFIINPQFTSASSFGKNKLTSVKSADKYGYIDEEGKIMINPQFDEASQFFGDVAIVKTADKYGLIDKEGKYVVNPQFEEIGYDLFAYLNDFSYKDSVTSDYLDVDAILKVVNVNNPENLTFNDSFQTILTKINKTMDDYSAYDDNNYVFRSKPINKSANYSFAFMGNIKQYDYWDSSYYMINGNPTGFFYTINLQGTAYGKTETIQKAFEKKLTGYTLMKKGYISGTYTSVYKCNKNYVITASEYSNKVYFYILNPSFDIANYISRISDKSDVNANDAVEDVAVDSTVAAVDSAAVSTDYYYGD